LALVASAHHERLDGTGYAKRFSADGIRIETPVITVSDIFDTIIANRPFRKAIPLVQALEIMEKARVVTPFSGLLTRATTITFR